MIEILTSAAQTLPLLDWSDWSTRFLFFTGKGGVGKTTIASAVAVNLAETGRRVLLVSTDPASNLDDVFRMEARPSPTPVPDVPGLFVMNIDPESAAAAYRDRVVGPYRGILPESAIRGMEEQFSGACTVEIAAFNEFTTLLTDTELVARYDHVLFDTAPTGHTLRLLTLPTAWAGFLETNTHGASCLGPLAGLEAQRVQYAATVSVLSDAEQTVVVLVSRPETSALREADRAGGELAELGIRNQRLVLNGVMMGETGGDRLAEAIVLRQEGALANLPEGLRSTSPVAVPLVASNLTGVAALRDLIQHRGNGTNGIVPKIQNLRNADGLNDLVRTLAAQGSGVVMTMGKGGVGKTTLAGAIAVALAKEGHPVHLSTTDPAAHLVNTLDDDAPAGITLSRIDAAEETRRYAAEVIEAAGEMDEQERALLEEDLRSPCTEEIAVFRAFARTVDEATNGFVVLDTAPTGHTLLLLDAAQSYHREVARTTGQVPEAVRTLLPRLRDANFTMILLVTLPESTPVMEAERLQTDLRRAGIEPFGWIINGSLAAADTANPLLAARASLEEPHIARVVDHLAARTWLVPWSIEAPTGQAALYALSGSGMGVKHDN